MLILPAVYETEVIAKAMGFNSMVEVLTPKSTREKTWKALQEMLGKYDT